MIDKPEGLIIRFKEKNKLKSYCEKHKLSMNTYCVITIRRQMKKDNII